MHVKFGMIASGIVAVLFVLSGAAPALAAEGATDETETDSARGVCSSGWRWIPLEREVDAKMLVGNTQANFNGTDAPAEMTFTSTVSGTFTASVDGSFEVGMDAKIASASAIFGTTFAASLTASIGNSITITVPAQSWGYGEYGIWNSYIMGEEFYQQGVGQVCNISQQTPAGLLAPFRAGWDTWTSQ